MKQMNFRGIALAVALLAVLATNVKATTGVGRWTRFK